MFLLAAAALLVAAAVADGLFRRRPELATASAVAAHSANAIKEHGVGVKNLTIRGCWPVFSSLDHP